MDSIEEKKAKTRKPIKKLSLEEEEEKVMDEVIEKIFNTYNVGEEDEEESGDAELDTDEFLEFIYVQLIENGYRKYDTFKGMQVDPNFK